MITQLEQTLHQPNHYHHPYTTHQLSTQTTNMNKNLGILVGGDFYDAMAADWFRYTMIAVYAMAGITGGLLTWGSVYLLEYLALQFDF